MLAVGGGVAVDYVYGRTVQKKIEVKQKIADVKTSAKAPFSSAATWLTSIFTGREAKETDHSEESNETEAPGAAGDSSENRSA
jgi:hypothetical protein